MVEFSAEGVEIRDDQRFLGFEKFVGSENGDEPAILHQGDACRQDQRFMEVVSNEGNGLAQAFLQRKKFALQLGAGNGVERTERLVHQQDGWIRGQGPRNANPLALASREFSWIAGCDLRIKPNELKQFFDALLYTIGHPVLNLWNDPDVAGDGEVRKEADLLDGIADRPAEASHIPVPGRFAIDEHIPTARIV